jgi:hypothetical protein
MAATSRLCVVCDVDIRHDSGRCTNSCCLACHARFCTPGGTISPGHGIDVKEARRRFLQRPHAKSRARD